MNKLDAVLNFIDKVNTWVARIMAVAVILILLVTMYGVIMRYAFNAPPIWGSQALLFLWIPVALLAGGYVLRKNGHVRLDLLYARWGPRGKAIVGIVTFAAFLLFSISIIMVTTQAAWNSTLTNELHTYWAWHGPVWPKRIVMAISAVLLLLAGLVQFVWDIRTVIQGKGAVTGTTGTEADGSK